MITGLISVFQGNWLTVSFNLALFLTALCGGIFMLIIWRIYREPEASPSTWKIKRPRFFTLNLSKPLLKMNESTFCYVLSALFLCVL